MSRDYDAIVVGSGSNGLVAAIRMAEAGRSVLVCEAAPRLGGAVATEELTLPGFRHDVFSSVYPAAVASPVFASMPLDRFGLRWVHPGAAMAHPLDDGRAAVLYRDLDRTAAVLDDLRPGDGRAWRAFVGPYLERFDALRGVMLGAFPPVAGSLKLVAALRLHGAMDFLRLVLLPADVLAEQLFAGEHATAWLHGSVMHGDVPAQDAGSAIAGVYLQLMGHAVGWPSPAGGADGLSGALVGYLAALGGHAQAGACVERVLVAGDRVIGVGLVSGEAVRAPIVIGDVGPHGLLKLAGSSLPASYTERLARFRPGPGTVKVDWALSAPIPWAAKAVRQAGTVHVGGTAHEINRAVSQLRLGEVPQRPFLLSGQQTVADPSRAPAGRHTAWAYTRVPRRADWTLEAGRHADRIEAQIERFAPGFSDLVLGRHVLSPPAMEARDANLIAGDVGGGSYALDQLVFRPVPGLSPYRTPLRGLYLGSASAFPGGAVHGVPGHAAARAALTDARLRRVRSGDSRGISGRSGRARRPRRP